MTWTVGLFLVIVVLTGLLLIPNALYAFRRFMVERNVVWLTVYFMFLAILGFLLVHVSHRTVEIVLQAREFMAQPDSG